MDKKTLRKVQLVQLEIAKEIKRVCEENNIEYWLDSGSMLGAVRHKGFIPWDDDMDIGMKRNDYDRFLKIAPKKLKPEYYLQQWETDDGYGLPFAKIRKNNTIFIENYSKSTSTHKGIYVDVFPYDLFGNSMMQGILLKSFKSIMQIKSGMKTWKSMDGIKINRLIKNIPAYIIAPFFSRDRLIQSYFKIATYYNTKHSFFYYPQGVANYRKWVIPKVALNKMIDVNFEDTTFKIPEGYDLYLSQAYGDYMKLPPRKDRGNKHQIIKVKF